MSVTVYMLWEEEASKEYKRHCKKHGVKGVRAIKKIHISKKCWVGDVVWIKGPPNYLFYLETLGKGHAVELFFKDWNEMDSFWNYMLSLLPEGCLKLNQFNPGQYRGMEFQYGIEFRYKNEQDKIGEPHEESDSDNG